MQLSFSFRSILLYLFALSCLSSRAQINTPSQKTDSVLNGYFQQCKAQLNTSAGLRMCDTLSLLAQKKGDTHMQIIAACLKLDHFYRKNDKESIEREVKNVKKLSRQYGELKYYYFAWGSRLITYYIKQQQPNQAIYEAKKMLGEAQQDKYPAGIGTCYQTLAKIYLIQSNFALAAENFRKSIEIYEQNGIDEINLPTLYASLAQSSLELNQPDIAEEALEKGVKLVRSPYQTFTVKKAYALLYIYKKELGKAKQAIGEMEQLFEQNKELANFRQGLYYAQIEYYRAAKEYTKALESIQKAQDYDLQSSKHLDNSLILKKGNVYWDMDDKAVAAAYYRNYISTTDSIRTMEVQNSTHEFSSLLAVEQLQHDKSKLELSIQKEKLQKTYLILLLLLILLTVGSVVYYRIYMLNKKLKTSEENLRKSKELAEQGSLMKTNFIQNISHELRTPLNSIVGFSQVLAHGYEQTDETQEYASIIETNSNNLLRLMDDIIDLSNLDLTDHLAYDVIEDINQSCLCSIERTQPLIKEDVKLVFEPSHQQLLIYTNPLRVSQILTHLLRNATKFTQQGSITLAYSISEEEHTIKYTVTDTGKGIPADQADRIFERFVKLNDFSQGTGLGLSICRNIAEKLGGSLNVDSTYRNGCRMVLILPLVTP